MHFSLCCQWQPMTDRGRARTQDLPLKAVALPTELRDREYASLLRPGLHLGAVIDDLGRLRGLREQIDQ